jgi:hypothetical protein
MKDPTGEGGGSVPPIPESLQVRAKNLPYRAKQLRDAAEALPDNAPQKWEMLADARALEQEADVLRELAGESAESAASLKAEIEGFEGRLQQLDDSVTKAKPVVGPATTLPRPTSRIPRTTSPSAAIATTCRPARPATRIRCTKTVSRPSSPDGSLRA